MGDLKKVLISFKIYIRVNRIILVLMLPSCSPRPPMLPSHRFRPPTLPSCSLKPPLLPSLRFSLPLLPSPRLETAGVWLHTWDLPSTCGARTTALLATALPHTACVTTLSLPTWSSHSQW